VNVDCILCLDVQRGDPVQLLPWLYLGSSWHASRRARLAQLGITGLLNVAADNVPVAAASDDDDDAVEVATKNTNSVVRPQPPFASMSVPIVDNCTADIASWFPDCFTFIGTVTHSSLAHQFNPVSTIRVDSPS